MCELRKIFYINTILIYLHITYTCIILKLIIYIYIYIYYLNQLIYLLKILINLYLHSFQRKYIKKERGLRELIHKKMVTNSKQ